MQQQVQQVPSAPPQVLEYGAWKSPISSAIATASAVSFQDLQLDRAPGKSDTVYWSELRFDEGGRYVICSKHLTQNDYTQWTPKDYNARTRVHEYGGGAFCVYDGIVYFSNFADQRLYVQKSADDVPKPITPNGWRFADAQYCAQLQRIFSVREDHTLVEKKETKEATNTIVVINPANEECHILASGCDFYSCPRVSPDSKKLVWVQWNHPNMPWDSTEIWTAELDEAGDSVKLGTAKKIAGGEGISVMQPYWTTDNQLLYIGDQSDWWNLYLLKSNGEHTNLCPRNEEIGVPHWVFGRYTYDLNPANGSTKIITTFKEELGILDLANQEYRKLESGFTSHVYVQFSSDGHAYLQAAGPTKFPCIIRINSDTSKVDILRKSREMLLDEGYLSIPREISWNTTDGKKSYGFLYLPQNKDFVGPDSSRPPLLVKAHGGPTGACDNILGLKIQYFTSRGFAVLDTNYRGSTGYGKAYRNELRGNWGLCDVQDCSNGAKYLADKGQVDPKRLCIDGGSAGGYTTLACLAFTDVFSAGASHYGVADLGVLAAETHKFESRYLDSMIAPFSEENKHIYNARSPIKHIDKFNCPIAFFQGDEDEIVPANQAEMMFNAVKEKKLPCAYLLFKGEQHGFRKAENIQQALDGEFYFFARVFNFEPADKSFKMEIANL